MEIKIYEKAKIDYQVHTFPWHVHPHYHTLTAITGGSALLEISKAQMLVQEGDLVFVPAGLAHRTVVQSAFSYEVLRFQTVTTANYAFGHFSGNTKCPELREVLTEILINKIDANHFLAALDKNLSGPVLTADAKDSNIDKCLAYIHQNYARRLDMPELSRVSLRSESHLVRTFKRRFGISPMRYLMGLKIDKSKELLLEGRPLAQVAFDIGFTDQSHLHRHFKRYTGLTPREYRRLVQ